jgi:predicted Rossmann fold nucleotide-binding protein DprA/Smf involved in DNA uptake
MSEKIYLAALHSIGITQKKLYLAFDKNQHYKNLFDNLCFEILYSLGFSEKQSEVILERKRGLKIDILQKKLDKRGVKIITIHDALYPHSLKQISNPPYLFYLR